ncbi:MAG TPA: DUF4347 domain-containing protein [Oscillatoriaceae cyanobacterium M33_DOE_052]|uniref:DUF4347 domain-containing protein n=1 Tax=Planktothricoides sp. SpSt-374 TaxID=2282167 RepID=A0A7C3ZLY9_9CYAN|nr:DUF4347 domain-containing protein [Oscillatoriaceae cyanobacterium M33_DOE_052]
MKASIIFVDPTVANYQTLLQGVNPDAQVVVLDTERSGIAQITETLAHSQNITAVHLLSHGSAGNLHLGSDILNTDNLEKFSSQLQQWGASLTENADILLYGCDVAAGVTGANFIQNLSSLTGADIAASNDLTGNPDLGGDWDLEITTDAIEADIPLAEEARDSYEYVLANYNVTVATDDGTGGTANTLSWAILQANTNPGDDTITLNTNVRLTGTPTQLIDSNIAFIGNNFSVSGDVNNDGTNNAGDDRPFFIKSGTVSFANMTITGGRGQGGDGGTGSDGGGGAAGMGGGIFIYDGAVAIDNVTFASNQATGGNGGGGNVGGNGAGGGGIGGNGGPGQPGGGLSGPGIGGIGDGDGQGAGVAGFGGAGGALGFGGFGGGSRGNLTTGQGTFGGSGQGGLGQGGGGAGLGGAILIRQGSLTLNNTTFNNNTATGGTGWQSGQGKGGAIFAMQSTTNNGSNQNQMPTALPIVSIYNSPSFSGNSATNHAGTATDNANFYAIINNAPTAANQTVSTNEDTDYTFIPTDFNFSDADSDTLQTVKITQLPTLGALQLSGVNVTLNQEILFADINVGNLKFIPVVDANGTNYDNFQFQVSDGKVYSLNAYTTTVDVTPVRASL